MVIPETIELIKNHYPQRVFGVTIERVCVGLYLSAVQLSDGGLGVASTVSGEEDSCTYKKRELEEFSPTKIEGQKVADLFLTNLNNATIASLRMAALNAISSTIIDRSNYRVMANTDPIDLIDIKPPKRVTLVGALKSYIKKIAEANAQNLKVLELNVDALTHEHKHFFVPANHYREVVPQSDVVLITGLTLGNSTIDGLLSACRPHTQVVVVGPSSGIIPDVLFLKGVSMVGATRILDGNRLFEVVSQGGAGYHLFHYCAQKICILNEPAKQ